MSSRLTCFLLTACAAAFITIASAVAGDPADPYRGIWTEDLPNNEQISKERLDLIIRYAAEGKQPRAHQLRQLYENDRSKFWNEIRQFMRENPIEGPGTNDAQGRPARWRDELQKQHEEFLTWLEEAYPDRRKELAELRESNPDEYFRRFGSLYRKYGNVAVTQKRNPELGAVLKEDLDLIDQRDALLRQITQADRRSKARLMEDLHEVISRRFDLIVRKKQLQYDDLRRRIERLRRDLESKEQELSRLIESKDEVTKQHLQELLNPAPLDLK